MSDIIIDSSVVAKWILPERDSAQAQSLITQAEASGDRLIILDLVLVEVANAIWKRHRQRQITLSEASGFLSALVAIPVQVESARRLLKPLLKLPSSTTALSMTHYSLHW